MICRVLLLLPFLYSANCFAQHVPLVSLADLDPATSSIMLSDAELNALYDFYHRVDKDVAALCSSTSYDQKEIKEECDFIKWAQARASKYEHCASFFVDGSGQLGKLGRLVAKNVADDVIAGQGSSEFLNLHPDIQALCPGFKSLSPVGKIWFYVHLFEIMGYLENTCGEQGRNTAANVPNGPAVCTYQLEQHLHDRSWRGPHCKVSDAEIQKPAACTACAIDIMKGLFTSKTRILGIRNPKDIAGQNDNNMSRLNTSYWQAMNQPKQKAQPPKGTGIYSYYHFLNDVTQFPGCNFKEIPDSY